MEVKQFVDSRHAKLDEFQKTYRYLKSQYSSTVLSAINERDPAKQQDLIQRVLSINSEMVAALRDILGDLNRGQGSFNPKTIDELTNELIEYQKEYAEIERTKDRVNTLKLIHSSSKKRLADAETMYTFYMIALVVLALIVAYLVIRTGWVTTVAQQVSTAVTGMTTG